LRSASRHKWKTAVEFRDNSWLSPDVYRMLDKHRAALCLHDRTGAGAAGEPNDAPFIYVRRHGPDGGRYHGSYSPAALEKDVIEIRKWLAAGRSVYVFFNNDVGGHAFRNAHKLRSLLNPAREPDSIRPPAAAIPLPSPNS
jgi:uncharacterized protein YecE (DUF72 family)